MFHETPNVDNDLKAEEKYTIPYIQDNENLLRQGIDQLTTPTMLIDDPVNYPTTEKFAINDPTDPINQMFIFAHNDEKNGENQSHIRRTGDDAIAKSTELKDG